MVCHRRTVAVKVGAVVVGDHAMVFLEKLFQKEGGVGNKTRGLSSVQLLVCWFQQMILETAVNIFIAFQDHWSKIFVGRDNDKVGIVAEMGKQATLDWAKVAADSAFNEPWLKSVGEIAAARNDFWINQFYWRRPVLAAQIELIRSPVVGGIEARRIEKDFSKKVVFEADGSGHDGVVSRSVCRGGTELKSQAE